MGFLKSNQRKRLTEPNNPHTRACIAADLEALTLHGLRRSFSSLTKWLETPAWVVAQIQGHKLGATAEKHYKVRPLELLWFHHEKLEARILHVAGVTLMPKPRLLCFAWWQSNIKVGILVNPSKKDGATRACTQNSP